MANKISAKCDFTFVLRFRCLEGKEIYFEDMFIAKLDSHFITKTNFATIRNYSI